MTVESSHAGGPGELAVKMAVTAFFTFLRPYWGLVEKSDGLQQNRKWPISIANTNTACCQNKSE